MKQSTELLVLDLRRHLVEVELGQIMMAKLDWLKQLILAGRLSELVVLVLEQ